MLGSSKKVHLDSGWLHDQGLGICSCLTAFHAQLETTHSNFYLGLYIIWNWRMPLSEFLCLCNLNCNIRVCLCQRRNHCDCESSFMPLSWLGSQPLFSSFGISSATVFKILMNMGIFRFICVLCWIFWWIFILLIICNLVGGVHTFNWVCVYVSSYNYMVLSFRHWVCCTLRGFTIRTCRHTALYWRITCLLLQALLVCGTCT